MHLANTVMGTLSSLTLKICPRDHVPYLSILPLYACRLGGVEAELVDPLADEMLLLHDAAVALDPAEHFYHQLQ